MQKFILRDEKFGAVLYDTKNLRYKFLSFSGKNEAIKLLNSKNEEMDLWSANTDWCRSDIIYSPIRVYYEITLKCNLRCNLCFNDSGNPRPAELTTQEILVNLDNLRKANVIDVRFTGGEITQHPHWFTILKHAKDIGFVVSCNTNGIYSNIEVIEKFLSLSLNQIIVSVDGFESVHEANRGKSTFNKTVNTIKSLSDGGAHIRINSLISKWSIDQVEQIIDLAARYAEEINFFPFRFLGRGATQVANSITMEEYYLAAQKAFNMRAQYPGLRILHFAQSFHNRSIDEDGFMGLQMGGPDGFTSFNITSDGNLWAGGYTPYIDKDCFMGNILTDDILSVWQRSKALNAYREKSNHLKSICMGCSLYPHRCPGGIYEIEHLRLLHPEIKNPFCVYGSGPSLLGDKITK